ncbi:MAG: hypothetical protein IPH18_12115 [Chitinophagaceae bacterium]|nr:hypothetical protein [Chitinophagaceae bacterium]
MKNEVKIYVYGSCHFSERLDSDEAVGNGGYGIVITSNGQRVEEISGASQTPLMQGWTLLASQRAKRIKEPSDIVVYLTNGYVIDTLAKGWLERWKRMATKRKSMLTFGKL